jgi:hypothetical protein
MIDQVQRLCPTFRGVCPDPIFIIGSPRSGTSVLAWALAKHSRLWTSAESDILFYLFGQGHLDRAFQISSTRPDGPWLQVQGVEKEEFSAFLGLGLNALFSSRCPGKRWVDQTPLYTLIADLLADMFPTARFLHILRDGRRVVRSMVNFHGATGRDLESKLMQAGRLPPWATDFRDACRTWSRFVDAATAFGAKNPTRSLTITNEDLVVGPEKLFERIFDFLGVPSEDGPANFCRTTRLNSSFPSATVDQFARDSVARIWSSWTLAERMTFVGEAGPAMLRYGLATADDLALSDKAVYQALLAGVRKVVDATLPPSCTVAVISKGDDEFLSLGVRTGWHLPSDPDGRYAGYHPADSRQAVQCLEDLRVRGAGFLLIPEPSFWWLDYYSGLRTHLDNRYLCIWSDATCRIYSLLGSHTTGARPSACDSHNSSYEESLTPAG